MSITNCKFYFISSDALTIKQSNRFQTNTLN
nr:MAG TPA: hypothetical protein [Caudoviricetes sp.]